jgi:hypothetical protein
MEGAAVAFALVVIEVTGPESRKTPDTSSDLSR